MASSSTNAAAPVALALCVAACLIATACAHGGGLHRWTLDPEVLEVIPHATFRSQYAPWIVAAEATNWDVLNTSDRNVISTYMFPDFSPPNNNLTVTGTIGLYVYLRDNCTEGAQTTVMANLKFMKNEMKGGNWVKKPYGKAYKHVQAYGYAFTGTCDAPGNLYRNDPMAEDNRFNLAYWNKDNAIGVGMNETDRFDGHLWGAAPNSYMLRGPEQADMGAYPMSFVLVVQGAATFCAEFEWMADPHGAYEWGKNCTEVGGH